MKAILSWLLLLGAATAAQSQTFPTEAAVIAAESAAIAQTCKAFDLGDGFLSRQNINGDGRNDLVVDYAGVACDGTQKGLCGSAGCELTLYLQQANGSFEYLAAFFGYGFDLTHADDKPPTFVVHVHGNECAKSGMEQCLFKYRIEGNQVIDLGEVPPDGDR